MNNKPHILFIVLDTQRADRLSCYKYPSEITPNLDQLATEATLFKQAIAPAQWTIPTHASLFTGQYPYEHGLQQMTSRISTSQGLLAERLLAAGYQTVGFSHNPLIGVSKNGLTRGFQSFFNYNHIGANLQAASLSSDTLEKNVAKKWKKWVRFLLAEGLGYSDQTVFHYLSPILTPLWLAGLRWQRRSKQAQVSDSLTEVGDFLLNNDEEKPVFAFVNLMGVHVPYDPPEWALDRFLPVYAGSTTARQWRLKANKLQVDVTNWLKMPLDVSEFMPWLNGVYDAETAAQDRQIGLLLNRLRATAVWENLVIVIVADHGDYLGEQQRLNHAFGIGEPVVHVPLLIRDSTGKFGKPRVVETAVSTRRVFHTLLTIAGAETQEENTLSLTHEETRKKSPIEATVMSEGYPLHWAIQRLEKRQSGLADQMEYLQPMRAIYKNNYKLIHSYQNTTLYDLQKDEQETDDIAQQLPQVADSLLQGLNHKLQTMSPASNHEIVDIDESLQQQLRGLGYLE